MKIDVKILSIPPYISTSWRSVDFLKVEEIQGKRFLTVGLTNGAEVKIPGLNDVTIEHIFSCHANSTDSISTAIPRVRLNFSPLNIDGLPDVQAIMEHNPAQANAPNLPIEITSKMSTIAKALGIDLGGFHAPKGEPHCNCPHCQIAKSLHPTPPTPEVEEVVTDEDLRFRDWEIKQSGEKLFEVIHPLDKSEHYQVFLGNPIGCTCGQSNCEHIRAVLLSS